MQSEWRVTFANGWTVASHAETERGALADALTIWSKYHDDLPPVAYVARKGQEPPVIEKSEPLSDDEWRAYAEGTGFDPDAAPLGPESDG
jgi:hypothetical protein